MGEVQTKSFVVSSLAFFPRGEIEMILQKVHGPVSETNHHKSFHLKGVK